MSDKHEANTEDAYETMEALLCEMQGLQDELANVKQERDMGRDMVHGIRKQRAIARNFGEQMERERDEAREALDRIARPVWWMQEDQKRKTGSINGISGGMALALSEDAEYLKGIARSALRGEAK